MATGADLWAQPITVRDAYLAMVQFLWSYVDAGNHEDDDVTFLASHVSGVPGQGLDPAIENAWLQAIEEALV